MAVGLQQRDNREGTGSVVGHTVRRLLRALPEGRGLAPEAWHRRHRVILGVLWLHVLAVPAYGVIQGYGLVHCLQEGALLLVLAVAAAQRRGGPTVRSVFAALGLMASSALVVHFSGGVIEAHFHFFVMVALLSAYQNWVPLLFGLAFIAFEHGIVGAHDATAVYSNNGSAQAHPWLWASIHAGYVLAAAAASVFTWTISEDEHRRALTEIGRSAETFRALFARNPQPMWVYDVDTLAFLAVNKAAITHYGYSESDFLAMRITEIGPSDDVATDLPRATATPDIEAGVCNHRLKDGRVIQAEVHTESLQFGGRAAELMVAQDITSRLGLEEELRRGAFHDPLTGLANRTLFHDRLSQAMARRERHGGPVAVITLDLDGFKAINDSQGHAAGDTVLNEVAARLSSTLRPADTIARMGGDEFAVVVEGIGESDVRRVAVRVADALRPPIVVGGTEVWISGSVGIAVSSSQEIRGDELIRRADVAVYEAKGSGKGLIEVFDAGMDVGARDRVQIAAELRRAIDGDQLFLEYQPIVSLASGAITGVEALVRWRHPERGVVSPAEFIPAAEESGLIVPIGEWVLGEACRQMREWESSLPANRRPDLSVNVSPRQIREVAFVPAVIQALHATGFSTSRLILEVTESTLVRDLTQARGRLEELRAVGIRIALDDFGSGYSSIGYLRELPLDTVKIDRMFIAGTGGNAERRDLLFAIVRLVDSVGLATVAEGIETAEELAYCRTLGVDFAQGYLFSRPLAAAATADLLSGDNFELERLTAGAPWLVNAADSNVSNALMPAATNGTVLH